MPQADPVAGRYETIKIVGTLVGALVLFIAFSDWMRYGNVRTCPSAHFVTLIKALEQYRVDSNGQLPPIGQQEELLGVSVPDKSMFRCTSGPKYLWPERPADVSQGEHLILHCPKGTHGFIRTFAWGIEIADGKFRVVRLKNSGETVPLDMSKIRP